MKEIKDVDGTSDKVSSVRNSSQQAFNPGDFPFVLWFLLFPSPLIPALCQPACPRKKVAHGVGFSSWEEEKIVGSKLNSVSKLFKPLRTCFSRCEIEVVQLSSK